MQHLLDGFDDPPHSDGALTALGVITSTVVDHQLVDVHRSPRSLRPAVLQYHGVWITSAEADVNVRTVTGRLPQLLVQLVTGRPARS